MNYWLATTASRLGKVKICANCVNERFARVFLNKIHVLTRDLDKYSVTFAVSRTGQVWQNGVGWLTLIGNADIDLLDSISQSRLRFEFEGLA
ncbi:hypothetical protein ACVJBD_007593 [Rhizobium mongolense]